MHCMNKFTKQNVNLIFLFIYKQSKNSLTRIKKRPCWLLKCLIQPWLQLLQPSVCEARSWMWTQRGWGENTEMVRTEREHTGPGLYSSNTSESLQKYLRVGLRDIYESRSTCSQQRVQDLIWEKLMFTLFYKPPSHKMTYIKCAHKPKNLLEIFLLLNIKTKPNVQSTVWCWLVNV